MNKQIVGIIIGIALISLVSATTIYSGESYSFPSEEFEYYTIVGNSSNMEGMNVSWENGNTTISFHPLFAPDNFTLIFFNQETEIITEHHYSSGGSSTKYVDKIIEVQNYVDREVIKEIEKEIPSDPKIIKEIPKKAIILIGVLSFLVILAIFYLNYLQKKVKKENG